MKRITLLFVLICFSHLVSFCQKKYEMVVEKIDGTETIIKVDDIVRTFFREIEEENVNDNTPQGVEAIDLGLPSGVKWASANIGATKPEANGISYTWGAYEEAIATWGGNWEMPTREDFVEINTKCTKQFISINGVFGWKFTGPNGNSIFLPGNYVGYWTSTLAANNSNKAMVFYIEEHKETAFTSWELTRNTDVFIRPVKGHATPDDVPASELNEQQLVGKWICYYQQWTDEDGTTENTYATSDYYIVLKADHTGAICSGSDELFEIGTNGQEKTFAWSVSGKKIIVEGGAEPDEWEVVELTDNNMTLRWLGGDNGDYIIVGKLSRE